MKTKAKVRLETDLVKRLKAWRKENGLSQRQAADVMVRSGVPVTVRTLQSWEIGDRRPVPMAAKLLETFLASVPKVKEKDRPKPYPKVASYRSEEDVGRIRELRAQGKTLKAIAGEFGISESAVSRICAGKRHGKAEAGSSERLAKGESK